MVRLNKILTKYEKAIPIFFFLIFIVITIPGITWGLPERLHPHEIVKEAFKAISTDWEFDTETFNYTSLPKHVMYWLGKAFLGLGYSYGFTYALIRLFSVFLGACVVSISYRLTRLAGGNIYAGILASIFLISNSQMAQDSRFAHNDIYLTFFVCLTAYSLIKYFTGKNRAWLYLAALEGGLLVSSKQNGIVLIFVLFGLYFFIDWKMIRKDIFRTSETLFICIGLTILGFGIGTPKAITSAEFYIKNMIAIFQSYRTYNIYPGDKIGIFSQWNSLINALGGPVFIISIITFIFWAIKTTMFYFKKSGRRDEGQINAYLVLLVCILAIDVPLLIGYVHRPRYFLSLIPLVVVLNSLFIQEVITYFNERKNIWAKYMIVTGTILIIFYSMLRVVSIGLMFHNDNRMTASEFIKTFPKNSSIEHTYYPPPIDKHVFFNTEPYPIQFIKWEWEEALLPPGYNTGEDGLEERQPKYLVWDSFTYSRFSDERVCERHQVECDFYKKLFAGETNYELIASFEYNVPWFIPEVKTVFLNPDIQIFQLVEEE